MPATKRSVELTKELAAQEKELARMEKVRAQAKKEGIKLTAEEETAYVKLKVKIDETSDAAKKYADARTKEYQGLKKEADDYAMSLGDGLAKAAQKGGKAQQDVLSNLSGDFGLLIQKRKEVDLAGGDTSAFDELIDAGKEFLSSTEMTTDQVEAFQSKLNNIDMDGLGEAGKNLADSLMDGSSAMGNLDAIMEATNLKSLTLSGTLTAIVATLASAAEAAAQMQKSIGLANTDAIKLNMNAKSIGFSLLGLGDELRGTQEAIIGSFDAVSAASNQNVVNTFMFMEQALGVSTEHAAELTNTLVNLTGASAQNAALMAQTAAGLAKANDLAPGAVIEEMASNGEMLAKFADGTAEGMARAAIQAKKMGIELSKVGTVMDGLLDLETSMTNEMEASVLLGRDLNLDRARQLALNNDIEGAMNAVLDQLGSEEEFNQMNAIQRQALADSIGVGVEDLANMVNRDGAVDESMPKAVSKSEIQILKELMTQSGFLGKMVSTIGGGIAGFAGFKYLKKGLPDGITKAMGKLIPKDVSKNIEFPLPVSI